MFNTLLTADPSSLGSTLIVFVLMIAMLYFLMIRPENKKKKEQEQMRNAVKVGDKITTIGGIVGTIVHIKEENVVIETSADRVRMELAKWSISTNNTAEAEKAAQAKAARASRKEKK